jgi:alkaline phosphatase D
MAWYDVHASANLRDHSPLGCRMTQRTKQHNRRYGIERRSFLQYIAAVSAIPTIPLRADEPVNEQLRFNGNPFTLGVASGDPEPDGVVIWTRLAPQPLEGGGMPNEPASRPKRSSPAG